MATKVGSLLAELGMNTANFEAGVRRAQTSYQRFSTFLDRNTRAMRRSINRLGTRIFGLGAAIAAVAGPAALIALTNRSREAIDEQVKFARVIGTTQEELAGMQLAAKELSGMVGNTVNMALQRMTRRVAEAAKGTGEAKQAIKDLGLDARILAQQDPAQTFRDIADAISKVPDEGERLRLAFKLFDSEGARLVTTLAIGGDALEKYREQAKALGITLADEDIVQIEAMNDSLGRAVKAGEGLFNHLNLSLSPILTQIANDFVDMRVEAGNFGLATNMVNFVTAALGKMGDVVRTVHIGWAKLWVVFTQIARGPKFLDFMFSDAEVAAYEAQVERAKERLGELLAEPMPSTSLDAWLEKARANMETLVAEHKAANMKINEEGEIAATRQRDIYDQMGSAITDNYKNATDAVLGVFRNVIKTMLAESLASGIRNVFSPSGSGGGVSGLFGKLFGFANGGAFNVGGSGGTDSQVVAFRATPGERVTVNTPGQQSMGGGVTIIQHNSFGGGSSADTAQIQQALEINKQQTLAEVRDLMHRGRM